MLTNKGLKSCDKKETLKLYPMSVHFNQNSIATIISFKEVANIPGVRITADKNQERAMTVNLQYDSFSNSSSAHIGSIIMTQKRKIRRQKKTNNINNNAIIDYSCIQTVKKIQTS